MFDHVIMLKNGIEFCMPNAPVNSKIESQLSHARDIVFSSYYNRIVFRRFSKLIVPVTWFNVKVMSIKLNDSN